jgi:hypothetical protein
LRTGVKSVVAGLRHTCALTNAGGVKCWGLNNDGQLGDGTAWSRTKPVRVLGLAHGVAAITAGGWHSCAVLTSGGVRCWGHNAFGQLGDGSQLDRLRPARVVAFGPPRAEVALLSRSVTVSRSGFAQIRLKCRSAVACHGSLTLKATARGRFVGSSRPRIVRPGTETFFARARHTVLVKVRLTPAGLKLLCRTKRLPTSIRMRCAQPDGTTAIVDGTILLLA